MTSIPASNQLPESVELKPNYTIPAVLIAIAIPIAAIQLWVGIGIGIFGLFLTIQTAIIKLKFTPIALEVYRGSKLIRAFPYQEWETWQIFWPPVPILFYFKEVKSIHFLPILFDPKMLKSGLEQRFPNQ